MSTSSLLPGAATRPLLAALCSAATLLLGACGGGGGDDGGAATDGSSAPFAITSGNALAVAADALDSATNRDIALGGMTLFGGVGATATVLATGAGLVTAVEMTDTVPCKGGGSVTLTRNPETYRPPATGDLLQFTAANCTVLESGVRTLSGQLAITVLQNIAWSPLPPDAQSSADLVLRMRATDFSRTADGRMTTGNGEFTYSSWDTSRVEVKGSSFTNRVATGIGFGRTFTLKNFVQASSFAGGRLSVAVDAAIETDNSRLGTAAAYSVHTPSQLVTDAGDFLGGSLRVTAPSSSLLLTVTATNTFRLDVDSNGDGVVDTTLTATRDALRSQL